MRTDVEILAAAMKQDRMAWEQQESQIAAALAARRNAHRRHCGDVVRQAVAQRLILLAQHLTPSLHPHGLSIRGVNEAGS